MFTHKKAVAATVITVVLLLLAAVFISMLFPHSWFAFGGGLAIGFTWRHMYYWYRGYFYTRKQQ